MSLGDKIKRTYDYLRFAKRVVNRDFYEVTFCAKKEGYYTSANTVVNAEEIGCERIVCHPPINQQGIDAIIREMTRLILVDKIDANAVCVISSDRLDDGIRATKFQPLKII